MDKALREARLLVRRANTLRIVERLDEFRTDPLRDFIVLCFDSIKAFLHVQ